MLIFPLSMSEVGPPLMGDSASIACGLESTYRLNSFLAKYLKHTILSFNICTETYKRKENCA